MPDYCKRDTPQQCAIMSIEALHHVTSNREFGAAMPAGAGEWIGLRAPIIGAAKTCGPRLSS